MEKLTDRCSRQRLCDAGGNGTERGEPALERGEGGEPGAEFEPGGAGLGGAAGEFEELGAADQPGFGARGVRRHGGGPWHGGRGAAGGDVQSDQADEERRGLAGRAHAALQHGDGLGVGAGSGERVGHFKGEVAGGPGREREGGAEIGETGVAAAEGAVHAGAEGQRGGVERVAGDGAVEGGEGGGKVALGIGQAGEDGVNGKAAGGEGIGAGEVVAGERMVAVLDEEAGLGEEEGRIGGRAGERRGDFGQAFGRGAVAAGERGEGGGGDQGGETAPDNPICIKYADTHGGDGRSFQGTHARRATTNPRCDEMFTQPPQSGRAVAEGRRLPGEDSPDRAAGKAAGSMSPNHGYVGVRREGRGDRRGADGRRRKNHGEALPGSGRRGIARSGAVFRARAKGRVASRKRASRADNRAGGRWRAGFEAD